MLGLTGMGSRRIFVLIPREGPPVAITHAIEQGAWSDWPSQWGKTTYSSWRALESLLAGLVKGKRVAMEYSAGDAIPYLDRVPAGVIEMAAIGPVPFRPHSSSGTIAMSSAPVLHSLDERGVAIHAGE